MNTYLKYQPPAMQFLAFMAFAGGFFFLNYIVSAFFFQDINAVLINNAMTIPPGLVTKFKLAQLASAIISFLIPALLFGYYSSPKALPYVGIQRAVSPLLLAGSVVLLLAVQPLIGYLGYANLHFNFGTYQKYIMEVEAMYDRALKIFLQMHSLGDLLFNLLIMALLPAVSEELFFRGAFQKAVLRFSNKPWLAILISASVFALLHGTFLKVVPIFVLGLLLGTVYHITRNLWYTITIHFINNGFAVVAIYYANRSEFLKKMSDDNTAIPLYAAIISAVASIGIIYFIGKKSKEILPGAITAEDNDFIA